MQLSFTDEYVWFKSEKAIGSVRIQTQTVECYNSNGLLPEG